MTDRSNNALNIIIGFTMLFILTVIVPSLFLFGPWGAAAQDSNIQSYLFYVGFSLSGFSLVVAKMLLELNRYWERNPELSSFNELVSLHNPKARFLGKRFKSARSLINITAASVILAMVVGLSISAAGSLTGAAGTPNIVGGSVSDSASLMLAVEPAVSAETLVIQFGLLLLTNAFIKSVLLGRGVPDLSAGFISNTVAVLFTTVFAFFYHSFRYGAVESSLGGVLVLFFILNVATVVAGSIIPAYLIHAATNFFSTARSQQILTQEQGVILAVIGMVVATAVLIVNAYRGSDT